MDTCPHNLYGEDGGGTGGKAVSLVLRQWASKSSFTYPAQKMGLLRGLGLLEQSQDCSL